jgi:hypothetical protein
VKRDAGQLLEARRLLRVCGGPDCSPTQQRFCSEWLADVDARVPSVVFSAKDAQGADLVDVKVLVDAAQVATMLDGRAVDVDPGPHSFVFVLADGTKAETTSVAVERGKGALVSVRFGRTPAPGATPSPLVVSPAPAPPPLRAAGGWSPWKTAGVVVAGVGLAGLAVGGAFGVTALVRKSADCPGACAPTGTASSILTDGNFSTAGLVAGGVLLAGGVTMFLLAPKGGSEEPRASVTLVPAVGPSAGGLQLAGRW